MITVIESLQNISEQDVIFILREQEAMPRPEYSEACQRARTAAAYLRKPTWSIYFMAHVNALLLGLNRIKYSDSYCIMKLMAVTECYSFGIMGQSGLTFEDFNLAIGPIAGVFAPELFAEEQTWTPDPVAKIEYVRPYRPASYRIRKPRTKIEDPGVDIVGLVDSLVKEASASRIPSQASTFHAEPGDGAGALDAILSSIVGSPS